MNKVLLIGRLCNDLEIKYVGERNSAVVHFTLAVKRNFKNIEGKYDTDFIRCELWNKKAENFCKYLKKGDLVGLEGTIKIDTYTSPEGESKKSTVIKCNAFHFISQNSKNVINRNEIFDDEILDDEALDSEIPF